MQTYDDGPTMGDLMVNAIRRGGDRVAFIHDDRQITYRRFGQMLSSLIQALEARGLRQGESIAVLSANRPEAFLIRAASDVMGLRITLISPVSSEDDHAYILNDASVGTLFVDPQNFAERARALRDRVPGLKRFFGFGPLAFGEDILAALEAFRPGPLTPKARALDDCLVVYTGGTTGNPKGVVHSHLVQVTMATTLLAEWDWPKDLRFLVTSPITHAAGAVIPPVLLRCGTMITAQGFEASKFMDLVERHCVTATFLVPTMVYVLLDHPRLGGANLSSLQLVAYGAASMQPARLAQAMAHFGPIFMQLYGQSECPMAISVLRQAEHDPVNHPQRLASCGQPTIGVNLRLLDPDGREVAEGEVGEVCVRGPLVTRGYLNKPEDTAAAWRHGWLYTGDMARRDADGFLYIVDRSKDMVISGGFNVFPREVEDALGTHPAVASSAVIGVPDAKWGEAVKAVVVLKPGAHVEAEELTALVKQRKGAVYAPKSVDFVDALPLTGLGKVDKKALRARYGASR
jgi:fatty-acyl-CoA synthase